MELSPEEQQHFNAATECHICGRKFAVDDKKVRDHCHMLGDFRGTSHNRCNWNFIIDPKRWKLPIFFHNLKGYDGHDYFNDISKLLSEEERTFPLRETFFNKLSDSECSMKD